MTTEVKAFDNALDAIVHIGAGRGRDLAAHLATGARRIVLVDADRNATALLKKSAASGDSAVIEVVNAAIAGEEKDAELKIYNLERVSGIREAAGLTEAYPGLRVVRTASVRAQSAASFVKSLDIDPSADNEIVIETPGEERAILKNLADGGLLARFSHVSVSAPAAALHKGAASAEEIAALLREAGYYVYAKGDEHWPVLKARSMRSRRDIDEIARLKAQLAEMESLRGAVKALAKSEADISELKTKLEKTDAARAGHEQKVIELSRDNVNLKAEAEKLKSRLNEMEAKSVDLADRKLMFEGELSRCEAQLELLKDALLNSREN